MMQEKTLNTSLRKILGLTTEKHTDTPLVNYSGKLQWTIWLKTHSLKPIHMQNLTAD
jgi:hypothetical protein